MPPTKDEELKCQGCGDNPSNIYCNLCLETIKRESLSLKNKEIEELKEEVKLGYNPKKVQMKAREIYSNLVKDNIKLKHQLQTQKDEMFKEIDLKWLKGYGKAHHLETTSEALTKLIEIYRAWFVDIFEDKHLKHRRG